MNQSIERQRLGSARTFEVFQAQQFYFQAQLNFLNSVVQYKAQYVLKGMKGEIL